MGTERSGQEVGPWGASSDQTIADMVPFRPFKLHLRNRSAFCLKIQNDCVPSKVVAMKGSCVASRPYVVLVDPFSTGAMLAPELDQRGETQLQLEAEKSM